MQEFDGVAHNVHARKVKTFGGAANVSKSEGSRLDPQGNLRCVTREP